MRVSRFLLALSVTMTSRCGASDTTNQSPHLSLDRTGELAATLLRLWSFLDDSVRHSASAAADAAVEAPLDTLTAQLAEMRAAQIGHARQLSAAQEQVRQLWQQLPPPRDCSDLPPDAQSGVYLVQPALGRAVPAFCQLDPAETAGGGGWTVIQQRVDVQPRQDFFRGWQDYKWGFGRLDAEFWWGLEHVWLMTSPLDRQYELRVDMADFEGGRRHALYQGFRVSSEGDNYRLTVSNYTGDAGDGFTQHSRHQFSTKDRDHDTYPKSCAQEFKGGWWYTRCHSSNLNGLYLAGNHTSYANGVNWKPWKGYHYSLKSVQIKIRPTLKL